MANQYFKFKQFTVCHDRCAMKVGTDGVLLGAWAPVDEAKRVLDVGTGTGLIALQLAQRNVEAEITAIDIDEDAVAQAKENVAASPFAGRIKVEQADFLCYHPEESFDLIVSNPPYFVDALGCPDKQRHAARHASAGLDYKSLFMGAKRCLKSGGRFAIIIPAEVEKVVVDAAFSAKLYAINRMKIFTKPDKPCRRMLFCFTDQLKPCREGSLCIELGHNEFTPEYLALTQKFYLKM